MKLPLEEKLLLDENVPRSVRQLLRQKGLDVKSVLEIAHGLRNSEIVLRAIEESRIIVTMDSDFLRFEPPLQQRVGIILIKVHLTNAAKVTAVVDRNLNTCLRLLKRRRTVILTEAGIE